VWMVHWILLRGREPRAGGAFAERMN
jgi:hypothetical protein